MNPPAPPPPLPAAPSSSSSSMMMAAAAGMTTASPTCCITSDSGPDLEPILTNSGTRREVFEKAYLIGQELGKGGYGTVYAAERLKDGLPVAVKKIPKSKIAAWCKVGIKASENPTRFLKIF